VLGLERDAVAVGVVEVQAGLGPLAGRADLKRIDIRIGQACFGPVLRIAPDIGQVPAAGEGEERNQHEKGSGETAHKCFIGAKLHSDQAFVRSLDFVRFDGRSDLVLR